MDYNRKQLDSLSLGYVMSYKDKSCEYDQFRVN